MLDVMKLSVNYTVNTSKPTNTQLPKALIHFHHNIIHDNTTSSHNSPAQGFDIPESLVSCKFELTKLQK